MSVVAASLEPPPSPACIGIRFVRRIEAPAGHPVCCRSNSAARRTRFSGPALKAGSVQVRSSTPSAFNANSSVSTRLTATMRVLTA